MHIAVESVDSASALEQLWRVVYPFRPIAGHHGATGLIQ